MHLNFCELASAVGCCVMMCFPWRSFILLLSRAVKASSLGCSQPRFLAGKGSGKFILHFPAMQKRYYETKTCSKHAKRHQTLSISWCDVLKMKGQTCQDPDEA